MWGYCNDGRSAASNAPRPIPPCHAASSCHTHQALDAGALCVLRVPCVEERSCVRKPGDSPLWTRCVDKATVSEGWCGVQDSQHTKSTAYRGCQGCCPFCCLCGVRPLFQLHEALRQLLMQSSCCCSIWRRCIVDGLLEALNSCCKVTSLGSRHCSASSVLCHLC